MYTIWYRDNLDVVCSFDCDTLAFAQMSWDTFVSRGHHLMSTRP